MAEVKGKYVWVNGELIEWSKATIHIVSHVVHYGTGVFEGMRAYETERGTAIFRLKDHLKRLIYSAKAYRMEIPFSLEELEDACKLIVKANELSEAYIRPIAMKDCSVMGIDSMKCPVKVAIAAWSWGKYLGEAYEKGCKCKTSSWRRIPPNCVPTTAKACGHYLNSQLAKMEAVELGFDEAIMLDVRGFVSEGPGENIFIVKDGRIFTPPPYASILLGITRDTIIRVARDMGYEVYEKDLTLSELYSADEAFFTGTAAEVTPIVEVDGIRIGDGKPGRITRILQKKYEDVVRGRDEKYLDWLTFI